MITGLYAATTGMEGQHLALSNTANNLANVSTTGYKKTKVEFQDLLYHNLRPKGGDAGSGNKVPTGVEIGNGSQVVSTTKVFTKGDMKVTGGEMDYALDGDGFFQVLMPDGTTSYTKDGALKIGPQGTITTASGLTVQSGFQQIPMGGHLYVAENGEVTVKSASSTQNFRLQLARFANPGGLQSIGGNLYIESDASGSAETGNPGENGFAFIRQGYLEMSNVNITEEMVNLIVAQRSYEANSKSIQSADEMLGRINGIKR
ncbi:MAG TPA: flagellar basal-body rod protein FlgG [Opitutales bacterium]|nr:flagellar basal-body rod protein FlgG [Opitutales bacterium]